MKSSQLIETLQRIIAEHGDIPITLFDWEMYAETDIIFPDSFEILTFGEDRNIGDATKTLERGGKYVSLLSGKKADGTSA